MSQNNPLNRYYNRIQALVTRIPENLRSIDISWIRLRRDASSSSSSAANSPVHQNRPELPNSRPSTVRESSTQSLFGSANSSQTVSPTHSQTATNGGQPLSRPPHSHLYRHSSHYPLLFGSYNNWSTTRDNRLISHSNSISNADKERNVLSAIMSIIVIATLATALAQPKWFSITGGVCTRRYLGLQEFFYVGNFNNYHFNVNKVKAGNVFDKHRETDTKEVKTHLTAEEMLLYGLNGDLKNCVTPEIVTLQRTIIGLCFFAIMFNLIQFFFDTLGVHTKWLNAVRSHALGNILSVLLCVVIVGVSYLVSDLLEKEQRRLLKQTVKNSNQDSHHIEVKFELSYYLVTFSGLLAIIAAASNLLRRPQHYLIDASDSFWTDDIDEELNSSATASPNWQSLNTSRSPLFLPPPPPPPHPSIALPPPPPYSP